MTGLKKTGASILLGLFLLSMASIPWKLSVKGDSNLIYIRPDGSLDPVDTPIQRTGDSYTFIANISGSVFVQRDNTFIDGNGCCLRGYGAGYGFDLTGRSNVTITNCTIRNFWVGIHLYSSSDTFLINNRFEQNLGGGFQIISSNGSSLVSNNSFTDNGGSAIWLGWSTGTNISDNLVTGNRGGVTIVESSVVMKNNNISTNNYNFAVEGKQLSHFMNDIDSSNTINNKPIYYWVNKQSMEVPSDAAYVAVVNSTDITVKNLNITNSEHGILLCFTSNSTIRNLSLSYNDCGIVLLESSDNVITNCNIENSYFGIRLQDSTNNSVVRNRIANDRFGITFENSSENQIYHNNFYSFGVQIDVDAKSANTWDAGYPAGGNYWSDYKGADLYSGQYQNVTGSDGIGDTPYNVSISNNDYYPLKEPWTALRIGTPSCTPSGEVPLNQEVIVTVNVTDAESEVENVTLLCKLSSTSSWTSLSMSYNATTGLYQTGIPSQPSPTLVMYKIIAFDKAGNTAMKDNMGEYYVYAIIPEHFAMIGLLCVMTISALVIVFARRKSIDAKACAAFDNFFEPQT